MEARVTGGGLLCLFGGAIAGAVVQQQQLDVGPLLPPQLADGLGNDAGFVAGGDEDGDEGGGGGSPGRGQAQRKQQVHEHREANDQQRQRHKQPQP